MRFPAACRSNHGSKRCIPSPNLSVVLRLGCCRTARFKSEKLSAFDMSSIHEDSTTRPPAQVRLAENVKSVQTPVIPLHGELALPGAIMISNSRIFRPGKKREALAQFFQNLAVVLWARVGRVRCRLGRFVSRVPRTIRYRHKYPSWLWCAIHSETVRNRNHRNSAVCPCA